MGVGTGKTRTVLKYLQHLLPKLVLIVGTKKGVSVWNEEFHKADSSVHMYIKTYTDGSLLDRAAQIKQDTLTVATGGRPLIFCINYEAFSRKEMFQVLLKIPFNVIIFDEVHKLRNHTTNQSKNAFKLAKEWPNAIRIGLTGTLIYNRPLDAFGVYRFINPNVFGTNWNAFRFHYAIWAGHYNLFPVKFINQEELREKIEANSFFVDRKEVLDLPEEQHIKRYANFDFSTRTFYNTLEKEFTSVLFDRRVTVVNVLDKVNKLQQITGGSVYQDGIFNVVSEAKLDLLKELLEEIGDQDIVVFYKYRAEKSLLDTLASSERKVYNISGDKDDYEQWKNETKPSILTVQIQSGSESLDFSKAGITIFYSLIYSYGTYEQALGRTSRGEAKKTYNRQHVLYYYLLIKNSIDEKIMEALEHKKDLIDELLG